MSNYADENKLKFKEKTNKKLKELPFYVTEFISENRAVSKMAERTCKGYVEDLAIFFQYLRENNPLFKNMEIKEIPYEVFAQINRQDIISFLDYVEVYESNGKIYKNTAAGKSRKLATLRSFYKFLNINNYTDNNPASLVENPVEHKGHTIIAMSHEEKIAFLNQVREGVSGSNQKTKAHEILWRRDLCIVSVLLGTGLRVSELVGIDITDIDWDRQKINIIRKGSKQDYVFFNDEVEDSLTDYIDNGRDVLKPDESVENALFVSLHHKRITVKAVENLVKSYANACFGTMNKITPHKCRSTFGSELYDYTGDIYLVADALGHSSVETTKKNYARMSENHKKKAKQLPLY